MNSVRPFQTKLMGVDQISQFRPNFTISAKFHNPGILGIPGVRAVSQCLRCFLPQYHVPCFCRLWPMVFPVETFHLSRCSMAQHFSNRHATGFARSGCSARHTGADECITPCLQYCASRSRNQLRIKEILGSLVLFLEKQLREIHCSPVPNERKEQQQSNYSKLQAKILF